MRALIVLTALLLAVPASFVITIMLGPLWGLVEERLGIEALGHALPAGWCFVATYAAIALAGLFLLLIFRSARPRRAP